MKYFNSNNYHQAILDSFAVSLGYQTLVDEQPADPILGDNQLPNADHTTDSDVT